jgi:SAM-dependent methyltransferase
VQNHATLEYIVCPYCTSTASLPFADERGFTVVRCKDCRFLYVNPRPRQEVIAAAVETGVHDETAAKLNVIARLIENRVDEYRKILSWLFEDLWCKAQPVHWLDVGSGYGEVMEAVAGLAPPGSIIEGLEPMKPKADQAKARGLAVTNDYLRPSQPKAEIISVVDVFSHVPHFRSFLADIGNSLRPGGEVFIETGNLADLPDRDHFPGELGLPDHLTFAGERHMRGFLEEAGFQIANLRKLRIDNARYVAKNVLKRMLGRPVRLGMPYTSEYRRLLIRAKLSR